MPYNARMAAPQDVLEICLEWQAFYSRSYSDIQYQNGSPSRCTSNLLGMTSILFQVIQWHTMPEWQLPEMYPQSAGNKQSYILVMQWPVTSERQFLGMQCQSTVNGHCWAYNISYFRNGSPVTGSCGKFHNDTGIAWINRERILFQAYMQHIDYLGACSSPNGSADCAASSRHLCFICDNALPSIGILVSANAWGKIFLITVSATGCLHEWLILAYSTK
jgi:hypothetical protein